MQIISDIGVEVFCYLYLFLVKFVYMEYISKYNKLVFKEVYKI